MIRVLVADDQPLVRSGFRMVIEERADLELAGEASDGAQALELARELDPDVILMDVRMPNLDGVEVRDDGEGTGNGDGHGRGLIGMRERVTAFGGSLETGRKNTGGFAVSARFPL